MNAVHVSLNLSLCIHNFRNNSVIQTNWYEHGEKSSKYFLNLEKRNKAKSHLCKLMASSNTEIRDLSVIMSHIKSLYSSLYKRRSSKNEKVCLEYLRSLNLPQISSCECESCEGLLTRKECWEALESMKNGRVQEMLA